MSVSVVLPLILTAVTLIGLLLSPALLGAGALFAPSRARRFRFLSFALKSRRFVLSSLVRLFGRPIELPPAAVQRALHRGSSLVILSEDSNGRRVIWTG